MNNIFTIVHSLIYCLSSQGRQFSATESRHLIYDKHSITPASSSLSPPVALFLLSRLHRLLQTLLQDWIDALTSSHARLNCLKRKHTYKFH